MFPHLDDVAGRWGTRVGSAGRVEIAALLAALHRFAPPAGVRREGLEVPGQAGLEAALADLGLPWDGGPLSEPARRVLSQRARWVVTGLERLDRLAGREPSAPVLTHGEAHPGNLLSTRTGPALVDWDTVGVAPPERDLWMLTDPAGGPRRYDGALDTYRRLSGTEPDPVSVEAYRLRSSLADVASFVAVLRGEHRRGRDTDDALEGLRGVLAGDPTQPYGPSARTA